MERGKCNSNELHSIIEEIKPEVIFEELPPDIFDVVYSPGRNPQSLEASTIKKYLRAYHAEHFPVDINASPVFQHYDLISSRSAEYTRLFLQQLSMIEQHGYSFLNSDQCSVLLDKIQALENAGLLEINDPQLISQYRSDIETSDHRESKMIRNIYDYSSRNKYDKALFICGAQHRKPIAQKIMRHKSPNELNIDWRFYNS